MFYIRLMWWKRFFFFAIAFSTQKISQKYYIILKLMNTNLYITSISYIIKYELLLEKKNEKRKYNIFQKVKTSEKKNVLRMMWKMFYEKYISKRVKACTNEQLFNIAFWIQFRFIFWLHIYRIVCISILGKIESFQ